MGSSSSAPARIILPEEEAVDVVDNERQSGEDKLNIPELEANYPEVKPPLDTQLRSSRRLKRKTVASVISSDPPSGRHSILPNIVETTEERQTDDKPNDHEAHRTKLTSNTAQQLVPKDRPGTPARIQTVRARQGYPLSTWPPSNMLKKGLTTMSVLHDSRASLADSLLSSKLFSNLNLTLDELSYKSMTKREIMLFERERCEYQQLLYQESISAVPERSPRVQMPANLTKAWRALQNSDQGSCSALKHLDYAEADTKATEHKDHKADTYSALIKDLTSALQSDALKVRAILSWISKQGIGRISFGNKILNPDTPNGYMQMIQENKGTYSVFFALLCRSACIPCAVVHGISKSSGYEVGSTDIDDLRNSWNAVFVEDGWRLVHPLWVCRSLRGHQQGGWMTIEKDGHTSNKLSKRKNGEEVATYNSYYIFTEPSEFVYRNFPDEPKWQLLKEPWSKETFVNSAYLRPEFFKRKLELLSQNNCVLISNSGESCNINVGLETEIANDLVFRYDLSIRVEETPDLLKEIVEERSDVVTNNGHNANENDITSKTFITENNPVKNESKSQDTKITEPNTTNSNINCSQQNLQVTTLQQSKESSSFTGTKSNLERFVAICKVQDGVIFEIRFPKKGSYKMRIYGGLFSVDGVDPPCIMEVRLECLAEVVQPKPLPFDPGIVGWGPGPVAERLGFFVPSHDNSVIDVTKDEEMVLQFILKRMMKIKVAMYHTERTEASLSKFVHHKILELREAFELRIVIFCPGKGEYAIKIDAISRETNITENACNYLVHTRKERPHEEYYTRKARRLLLEGMLAADVSTLEEAVQACKQCGLTNDDPEFKGGRNRLEFLQCKKALKDCLLIHRIDVVEQAIHCAKNARFSALLSRDLKRAERHYADICELNEGGWNNHIPEIDRQSVFELYRLRKPKDEIYHTMKAVYMLLGFDTSEIQTWSQIQLLLRKGEATLIEMARLEKYLDVDEVEVLTPDGETMEKIQHIVDTHSEEDVRKIDNTAAAYYQWVVTVLTKLKKRQREKMDKKTKEAVSASHNKTKMRQTSFKKGIPVSNMR